MVSGALSAIVTLLLASGFVLRQADHFARTSERSATEGLVGVLLVVACGAYYGAIKFYCAQWFALAPRSVARALVERAIAPAVTIALLVRMPVEALGPVELSLLALLAVALMDLGGGMRRGVERRFADLDTLHRRLLFAKYPPRERADLLPMDLLFFLLTVGLLVKRFT